jgi:hypothetical protein
MRTHRTAWNKGRLLGQKPPLKPKEIWGWAACIGLDQSRYGTHSLRRTKATLIYKRTKNSRSDFHFERLSGRQAADHNRQADQRGHGDLRACRSRELPAIGIGGCMPGWREQADDSVGYP